MATTGTHNFNLDLNLLVEEAFERCGADVCLLDVKKN
jgi:hypothetical protein